MVELPRIGKNFLVLGTCKLGMQVEKPATKMVASPKNKMVGDFAGFDVDSKTQTLQEG